MGYIGADFFARDTITVARDLIGTILVVDGCEGKIVETEAYTTDAASHAITRSNKAAIMRETHAYVYVYLIYGMHYCLNFTTEREGVGAVLIRAAEPISGIELMTRRRATSDIKKLASGPGRLAQAFGIDSGFNGTPVGLKVKLRERAFTPAISKGPRIGITRATELEWRFYETASPFVSRPIREKALI